MTRNGRARLLERMAPARPAPQRRSPTIPASRARRALPVALLLWPLAAGAQSLPTAAQVVDRIGVGWNLGNTLEVPRSAGGETGWGNPKVTQALLDGVKAAGFDAVRIPCAWDGYADPATHRIDAAWLARVEEVVDYAARAGLYVVLNVHWDGGWLENHPLRADQAAVNEKQRAYWTQIAQAFRGHDEHLLFAATNEVNVGWAAPTSENITAQQSYLQTFVDAVRATGGNNATRPLIVQTYSTNIGYGLDHLTLPRDPASDRLIVEVHYYDPFDYTGNRDGCLYWGAPYPPQSACSWAQESWLEGQLSKARARWVDRGIPVIVGEYGPMRRTWLTGQQLADHLASRRYYLEYFNASAARNGLKTFYWDNGARTNEASALLDRATGAVIDQDAVDAILKGAGVSKPGARHTLAITTAGAGSVSRSPDAASYPAGAAVTLTATPASGSEFAGWSGDAAGATNPLAVTLTRDLAVVASFVRVAVPPGETRALAVVKAGAGRGSVVSAPAGVSCGGACSAEFAAGTRVTLTAAAEGGSTFSGWGGACTGTETCTVSMTEARSVTATFGVVAAESDLAAPRDTLRSAGGCASGGPGGGSVLLLAAWAVALRVRRGARRRGPAPA